jgi:hypothetical protein
MWSSPKKNLNNLPSNSFERNNQPTLVANPQNASSYQILEFNCWLFASTFLLLVDWCQFSAHEDAMQFYFIFSFFWFQNVCKFFQKFCNFFSICTIEKQNPQIFFVFTVQKNAPKTNDGKKSSKRNQYRLKYYNSVTNLKFQHKPKYHLSKILR